MAEDILIDVDVNSKDLNKLNSEVNSLNKNLEQTNEQFEKNTKTNEKLATSKKKVLNETQKLRQELKQAKSDMLASEEGTKQYANALARAASAQQKLKEVNDKTKLAIKDFGDTAKNLAGGIAGISGGFTAAQGLISLLGIESENTAKALLQIQSALAVTQGLTTFADSIDSLKDLYGGLKASFQMSKSDVGGVTEAVTELSTATENAGDGMEKIAKESAVIGSNVAGVQNVKDGFDDFNKSIEKNTISLKEYYKELGDLMDMEDESVAEKKHQELEKRLTPKQLQTRNLINEQKNLAEATKKDSIVEIEDIKKKIEYIKSEQFILDETAKKTDNVSKANEKAAESTKKLGSATGGAVKNILGMMGQMVLWTAIIGGVIWAISALIEKLNEIPKELEIKLKMSEEVEDKMQSNYQKALLFAKDLGKAHRDGDKERIKKLEEIGLKEFDLHQKQLKNIGEQKTNWLKAFDDYLKKAQDTYYNEALAKRKAENFALAEENKQKRILIKEELLAKGRATTDYGLWKQIQMISEKSTVVGSLQEGGLKAKVDDLIANEKKQKEDLQLLNRMQFKNVYSADTEKLMGGTSTKIDIKSDYTKKSPLLQEYDKELELITSKYKEAKIEMTEEEKELNRQFLADVEGYGNILGTTLKRSELTELQYYGRVLEARRKDLTSMKEKTEAEIEILTKGRDADIQGYSEKLKNEKAYREKLLANDKKYVKDLNKITLEIDALQNKQKKKPTVATQTEIDKKLGQKDDLTTGYQTNIKDIGESEGRLKDYQTKLNDAIGSAKTIEDLQSKLLEFTDSLAKNASDSANNVRNIWLAVADDIGTALNNVGNSFSNLSQMSSANMQTIENNFAHKKNMMELDTAYTQASSEEQAQMMYKLEKEKYEVMKVEFERKKAFDIGVVALDMAKSLFGTVKNFILNGGTMSPVAIAGSIIETATVLTSGIAQINEIKSRKLEQPVPPSSGGGKGGAVVALTPNQNSLTSKEENLNMMNKSNLDNMPTPVVRVSEINDVQKKVTVLETNSKL